MDECIHSAYRQHFAPEPMPLPVPTHPLAHVLTKPVSTACNMYFFYRSFPHKKYLVLLIDTEYHQCYYRVMNDAFINHLQERV
jgi:hypothetical protein